MIVADANLLVFATFQTDHVDVCRRVRRRDSNWAVPSLWRSEFLNAAVRLARAGQLPWEELAAGWASARDAVAENEWETGAEAILELAASSRLTAYDLEYVALARRVAVPLATFDRQILNEFPGVAVAPAEFAGPV